MNISKYLARRKLTLMVLVVLGIVGILSGLTPVYAQQETQGLLDLLRIFPVIAFTTFLGIYITYLKGYEWTTLAFAYLGTSICVPLYMAVAEYAAYGEIMGANWTYLDFAFGLLCAYGAVTAVSVVMGRLSLVQYAVFFILFTAFYIIMEYVSFGAHGSTLGIVAHDPGGSILIYTFPAYFGMGATLKGLLTKPKDYEAAFDTGRAPMTYCLIGMGFFMSFWGLFNASLAGTADAAFKIAFNTTVALYGSMISGAVVSAALRGGKPSILDWCWGGMGGGVAIGSACDIVDPWVAFVIGIVGGIVATFGFAKAIDWFNNTFGIDSAGAQYLAGWCGILGALIVVGIAAVDEAAAGVTAVNQLVALVAAIVIAVVGGAITGGILSVLKRPEEINVDKAIWVEAEEM